MINQNTNEIYLYELTRPFEGYSKDANERKIKRLTQLVTDTNKASTNAVLTLLKLAQEVLLTAGINKFTIWISLQTTDNASFYGNMF